MKADAPLRVLSDFRDGLRHFAGGLRFWASNPKVMLFGAIPAIIVSVLMFALIIWSVPQTYAWATAMTGFAEGWSNLLREGLRITLGIALAVAIIYFCIVTFVTITLLVGDPFYERIWRAAEQERGGFEEVSTPFVQQLSRTANTVVRSLGMGLLTSLLGLLIGLIPLVGGALAALFVGVRGSRALALELTGFAADARGWGFRQRKQAVDRRLGLALGTILPFYLLFMIPGGAVLGMPSAVVAGTSLLRDLDSAQRRLD